jgi:hypothetical protein
MYFDHSKRNYYRFPSKNSVSEIDKTAPYYFPEKDSHISDDIKDCFLNSSYYYDRISENSYMKGD